MTSTTATARPVSTEPEPLRVVRGHRARLARTVAWVHAAIVLGFVVVVLTVTPASHPGAHRLVGLALLVLAADIAKSGPRLRQQVAYLALLVWMGGPAFDAAGDLTGGLVLAGYTLGATRLFRGCVYVGTVAVGVLVLSRLSLSGAHSLDGTRLHDLVLPIALTWSAGAFVRALERGAQRQDDVEAATTVELAALRSEEERARAVGNARRVLHDDVLTALRSLSDGSGADVAVTRAASAEAVRSLESFLGARHEPAPRTGSSIAETLARVARSAPVDVLVHDRLRSAGSLPSRHTTALAAAVGECLRNVERHAGVRRAEVDLAGTPDAVVVTVRDRGRGLAPGTSEGFGLTESVRGTLRSVGGEAVVRSGPAGTDVELRVPRRSLRVPVGQRVYDLTSSASGGAGPLVRAAAVPQIGAWTLLGGISSFAQAHPWPHVILLVACAALSIAVAHRGATRAPSVPWMLGLLAAVSALEVVGLLLTPAGGLLDERSWPIGFLSTTVLLIGLVVPVAWSATLIGSQVAIIVVAVLLDPALSDGLFPVASVNALVATPAITVAIGMLLRRNGRAVEAERLRVLDARVAASRREHAATVAREHLGHARDVVLPLLRDVAEKRVDLGPDGAGPELRERARLLGLETRDDLYVPGAFDDAMRAELAAARRRGARVDVRDGFPARAWEHPSGAVLTALCRVVGDGQLLTVRPAAGRAVRFVVAPPLGPDQLDAITRAVASYGVEIGGDTVASDLSVDGAVPRTEDGAGDLGPGRNAG